MSRYLTQNLADQSVELTWKEEKDQVGKNHSNGGHGTSLLIAW
jgi:hypothetical protein